MKTVIRTLIALVCLSALLLCFVGCNNTSLHVFVFNTPDNFDSLSAEEKIDWGRKNGYLVVMRSVDGKSVVENEEKLNDFLESKTEGKELSRPFVIPVALRPGAEIRAAGGDEIGGVGGHGGQREHQGSGRQGVGA